MNDKPKLHCAACNVLIDQNEADAASEIVGEGHETMCQPCAEAVMAEELTAQPE